MKNTNSPEVLDYLGRLYWFDGQSELAIEKEKLLQNFIKKWKIFNDTNHYGVG